MLLIIDPSYLRLWSHDRKPVMPDGFLSGPEATERARTAVDLRIVGPDALAAGKALGRQWHPLYIFDIPRDGVDRLRRQFADLAKAHGFDARLEILDEPISHRRRVDLALAHGDGAGEAQAHGIWNAVVGDLPTEMLEVVGEPMPEDHVEHGRLRRIVIRAREGDRERSEHIGSSMVDWGMLLAIDVEAAGAWRSDSLDGQADFVFWGRDASKAAKTVGATELDDEQFGWRGLPLAEASTHAERVIALQERKKWVFATDWRPHSHHYQLMEQVRASEREAGVVALGGAQACGFATTWGDGVFEVHRDLDSDGRLLAIRIELGTEQRVELMSRLRFRWNTAALVSRKIWDEGEPVRFMYREAPDREDDSGWRMFSGSEDDEYNADPSNVAVVRLSDLGVRDKLVEALLDEPTGSVFERRPGAERFERVTDWKPAE